MKFKYLKNISRMVTLLVFLVVVWSGAVSARQSGSGLCHLQARYRDLSCLLIKKDYHQAEVTDVAATIAVLRREYRITRCLRPDFIENELGRGVFFSAAL